MNKINFRLETDRAIERLCADGRRAKLLLHACCAPCSSYVLEYLTQYFDITVFFSNQNIMDETEYKKRLGELYRLCSDAPFCKDVKIVEDDFSPQLFADTVKGLEKEPEGGARCEKCFLLRLSRTAEYAKNNGFPLFATTLTVSPYKNAPLINAMGKELSQKYEVEYLPSDFKKRGGYQRSIALSKEYNLYRQHFCGCPFSMNTEE